MLGLHQHVRRHLQQLMPWSIPETPHVAFQPWVGLEWLAYTAHTLASVGAGAIAFVVTHVPTTTKTKQP